MCVCVLSEASKLLPEFVKIDLHDQALPDGIHLEHLKAFQALYREHCEVGTGWLYSLTEFHLFLHIFVHLIGFLE